MRAQKMGSMAPCVFFRIDVSCIAPTPMGRDAAQCGWLQARGEDLEIGRSCILCFFSYWRARKMGSMASRVFSRIDVLSIALTRWDAMLPGVACVFSMAPCVFFRIECASRTAAPLDFRH